MTIVAQELSLAERLGYFPSDRLLIVNCDDFGSSHAANVAIENAIGSGLATSATLMVPCPWAREAATHSKALDVGVHLTLTAEYPGYRWRSLTNARSLHDRDGFLPRTSEEVWANADLSDVEVECHAQIDQALAWGVDVTHLDAHMGTLQIKPQYYEIYLRLASHYRLPMRMVSETYERQLGFPSRTPAIGKGILFPDRIIAPKWGTPARESLVKAFEKLRTGVSEIFLHPVEDGSELRGYDLENPSLRAADYACLMDSQLKRTATESGIVTISYRRLRDGMRT